MTKLSRTREMLIKEFLNSLNEEKIPWQKGWKIFHHYNPATHYTYKGVNQFLLTIVARKEEYDDPRWMTYNQIKSNGYHLKDAKGKGVPIEFWSAYDVVEKKTISLDEAKKIVEEESRNDQNYSFGKSRIKYICKIYYVFNAKHIEGLAAIKQSITCFENKNIEEFINRYLENENIVLYHSGNEAFYNVRDDSITMPPLGSFESEEYYFATVLHEISHSSGHENRLNRLIDSFGSENYAKEELRAEISSSFLYADLNLHMSEALINRSKSYIQSWIQIIEDKPNELFKAIHDAENIVCFVQKRGEFEKIIETDIRHSKLADLKLNLSIKGRIDYAKNVQIKNSNIIKNGNIDISK